jgi:ArsR family metal-binding transcriptional regulator
MSSSETKPQTNPVDSRVDLRVISASVFPDIKDVYDEIQQKVNEAHAHAITDARRNRATVSNFDNWIELSQSNTAFALARQVTFL